MPNNFLKIIKIIRVDKYTFIGISIIKGNSKKRKKY